MTKDNRVNSNRDASWHKVRSWLPVALNIGLGISVGVPQPSVSVQVNLNQDRRDATSAPLEAEDFWAKVMHLLSEHNGSITKERFQEVLGVRFEAGTVSREAHATTYWSRDAKEGYFEARLTIYDEKFKSVVDPVLSGAHLNWYIGWDIDAFGDSTKGDCIRADHVRASLIASGWTAPWVRWGIWEEIRAASDPTVTPGESGAKRPPSVANFFRQVDVDSGHRDRLPRGVIDSAGDFRDSCVTGIVVEAGL